MKNVIHLIDFTNPEIVSAFIQSGGVIIAAVIAAFFAKNIVNETVKPLFLSYSDKSQELRNLTQNAVNDIFVIVAIGNRLLDKYLFEFECKLDAGIRFRYLLLDRQRYKELALYMHGEINDDDNAEYVQVLQTLLKLQAKYPGLVEIRIFHGFMPASYIGIDTCPEMAKSHILSSSVIQTMLYQYRVPAKNSPITCISPKSDEKCYRSTVSCMKEMWKDASPISKLPDEGAV